MLGEDLEVLVKALLDKRPVQSGLIDVCLAERRAPPFREELMLDACRRVIDLGWVEPGQRVAVTAGLPSGVPGSTSLFQVQQL